MSPATEAFYLPALFLTVSLLGGVRVADRVVLLPPPLYALVLGLLLFGVLARTGAVALHRLMNSNRAAVANLNGLLVMLTTFLASAQVFNLVTVKSAKGTRRQRVRGDSTYSYQLAAFVARPGLSMVSREITSVGAVVCCAGVGTDCAVTTILEESGSRAR